MAGPDDQAAQRLGERRAALDVDRSAVHGKSGFLESFGERRVCVARAGDILGGGPKLDGRRGLGDHVAGARAQDVNAHYAIGRRVREYLHLAVDLRERSRTAVGPEREDALAVLDVRLLEL